MSATGLDVFDKTAQTTNIWLDEIMDTIGPDRRAAWKVLSTVLHKIRDRVPVELAAHLGAELPLLVRGAFYDQFEPAKQPTQCRNLEEFVAEVDEWLADTRPVNARDAIQAVFRCLSHHVPAGQIRNIQGALPKDIREFWQSSAATVIPPPEQGEAGRYRAARGDGATAAANREPPAA
jgi:uncharacterized protein (DUF2267 family)